MLKKMELREGVGVFMSDGKQAGKIKRFVLDPATNEITHIVVQKGWLSPDEKVVPMQMVRSIADDKVILNEDVGDFDRLPSFEEKYFVAVDEGAHRSDYPTYEIFPAYYSYPPQGYGGYGGYPATALGVYFWQPVETKRNIPEDAVSLKEGANIISSNGEHVGDIERLFVETDTNKVTHFVITQGILFKERKIVPVQWVKSVGEDKVYLLVSSQLLERLPPYEPLV